MTTKGVTAEAIPTRPRSVHIEIADNGYIVRVEDSDYKEIQLVFTSQTSMIKMVKEATTMGDKEIG